MNIRETGAPWHAFTRSALRMWTLGAAFLYMTGAVLESASSRRAEGSDEAGVRPRVDEARLDELDRRARYLAESLSELETLWAAQVQPIQRELARRSDDEELVRRVALALVREGREAGVDPHLLFSVLMVENPDLLPAAKSFVGATGLMQVMPVHAGSWGCESDDLSDPDVNICHGARILAHYLRESGGNLDRALLRYNGCVRGTNTPDCGLYPMKVYRNASLAMFRAAP